MKVRDVMTTEVRTARRESTLEEVATIMRDEDVGSVPVLDGKQLCGIVTDRDIVVRCIAEGMNPAECTVQQVLSEEPMTVEPDSDIDSAERLMGERQVRRLPVVKKGKLVGIVSIGDLAVKSDEEKLAHTLEQVSEGVRASGHHAEAARRSSSTGTQQSSRHKLGVIGGGRQQTMEQESGRHKASTEGRSRIDMERGDAARGIQTSGHKQGIANRSSQEENERQGRVTETHSKTNRRRKAS